MINDLVERVACYIRVSHQEQKLHGISLDAQRDKLKEYADKHNLKIIEWYEDEGVSGRKLIKKRPELQRMLNDAKAGKFDRILFIKLDRFFRSVAEYHECMKYIDPVIWTATEEKYDLNTANGRAFVNMKLTIAELEADQTGERINIVNEYKVKTGQAMTGAHRQGLGFTVKKIDGIKRVVKDDETKDLVIDYINFFLTYQNKQQAYLYIKDKYNTNITYRMLSIMLTNTKLYGYHRGNDNYCEPYIDKETFDKIQRILSNNIKTSPTKRIYLFTGLLICPDCGRTLTAKYDKNRYGKEYYSYRCNKHYTEKSCNFTSHLNEQTIIEANLLDNLDKYINVYIEDVKVDEGRVRDTHAIDKISSLKGEISRVKNMYRKGDMTESEYDKDMSELKSRLANLESQLEPIKERDLSIYEDLLRSNWRDLYNALTKENKRAFWRKYIKRIEINMDGTFNRVIFF